MLRLLPLFCLCGCWDITDLAPDDGRAAAGSIQSMLNSGVAHTTTGAGTISTDPVTVQGVSSVLTFALTAGDADNGDTAKLALITHNVLIELPLSPTSRSKLEVHEDNSGCVASGGTVHLQVDDTYALSGDFEVTGIVFGGTDPCTANGTLTGVPVNH